MNEKLDGIWEQIKAIENGKTSDQNDKIILRMSNGVFSVERNGHNEMAGTYQVVSTSLLIELDWNDLAGVEAGKTFKSICEITENNFRFCAADEGMSRPVSFAEIHGHTLRWFARR